MEDDGVLDRASAVLDKLCTYMETVPGTNQIQIGFQWSVFFHTHGVEKKCILYALCMQPRLHRAKTWETTWMKYARIGTRWRVLPGMGGLCFLCVCVFPSGAWDLVLKKTARYDPRLWTPMWQLVQTKTMGERMCCQLCLRLRCPNSGFHFTSSTTLTSQRMGVLWLFFDETFILWHLYKCC